MESVEKLLKDKNILLGNFALTRVSTITPSGTIRIEEGEYKMYLENGDQETLHVHGGVVF